MKRAGGLLLSGGAIAWLAGCESLTSRPDKRGLGGPEVDIAILNGALTLEHEIAAAYEAGIARLRLGPDARGLAERCGSDHRRHVERVTGAVTRMGGTPIKALADYGGIVQDELGETGFLRLVAGLEHGVAAAYLGAVPAFADRDLSRAAAAIMAAETMHLALLRRLIGDDPVPSPVFF